MRDYLDALAEDEYFRPEKYYELEQRIGDARNTPSRNAATRIVPRTRAREAALPQTTCHCGSTLIPEGALAATHLPSTHSRVHHNRPGTPCHSEHTTRQNARTAPNGTG